MVFLTQVRISKSGRPQLILSSVPAGVATSALILFSVPGSIPHRERNSNTRNRVLSHWRDTLQRVDLPGTMLLLGAGLLLITALQLAGNQYSWKSNSVIVLLVFAAVLAVSFFSWEFMVSRGYSLREPVFPWRFLSNRVWIMMLL